MALLGFANSHNAQIEPIGGETEIVADANGELAHEGFLRGDAGAYHRQVEAFLVTAIDDSTHFFELTTLASRIEAERHSCCVARSDGFVLGVVDGGASTGGIALLNSDSLLTGIAKPEGTLLDTVSLLNGAKIDGINAKLTLYYNEDAEAQAANVASLNALLDNLASTGKLIRLSNFDIKYKDAEGASVTTDKITDAQRQNLADYYGYVIKTYMSKIPNDKQAGLCKGNMVDTTDPVGLWTNQSIDNKGTKDWVRNATYKAFCDALKGK